MKDQRRLSRRWTEVKAQPEFNSGEQVVEAKSTRTLNELYAKLLQMGSLADVSARQAQFHGDRSSAIGIIDNNKAEVSPVYMEDHDVERHIRRAKEQLDNVEKMKELKNKKEVQKLVDETLKQERAKIEKELQFKNRALESTAGA